MTHGASAKTDEAYYGTCANCCRDLMVVTHWYWELGGRIWRFCSQRCHDRFVSDPVRCLIVSPLHDV